jgi:hypothetical protein
MPKHHMYEEPDTVGQDITKRLELYWARESRSVMLGSTAWQGDPGQVATDREWLDGEPPTPAWDGRLLSLDRGQINHLIKELRIARDQAYGKDE